MKCSYAAFGEQNKIDNDSKCQQVYKSQNFSANYYIITFVCLQQKLHEKQYYQTGRMPDLETSK